MKKGKFEENIIYIENVWYDGAVYKWCHPLRGSAKMWRYSISLFSKMGEKARGDQKSQKMGDIIIYGRLLWFNACSLFWNINSTKYIHISLNLEKWISY